jgi:hypothetical protein
MPLVERAHDVHRLDEDLAVVVEHGHERLPAGEAGAIRAESPAHYN